MLIRELASGMNFVELSTDETFAAFAAAQRNGVRGGRVRDWMHAQAAKKAKVTELLTDNLSDFAGLEDGFVISRP